MNGPDKEAVEKALGWHINAMVQYLQEIHAASPVRATVMTLTIVIDGSSTRRQILDLRLVPSLPGITAIEKELGLLPEDCDDPDHGPREH